MKLKKIAAGWYATEDGTYAVIGDDPGDVVTKLEADGGDLTHAPGIGTGCATQREWQVVHDPRGRLREEAQPSGGGSSTIVWVDTLREGRAEIASRLATRERYVVSLGRLATYYVLDTQTDKKTRHGSRAQAVAEAARLNTHV